MKRFFTLSISLALTFVALPGCKKDDPDPVIEMPDVQGATLLKQGSFESAEHTTTGTVKLYGQPGKHQLVLENFRTDNGPSLYVYLAKDRTATDIVDLGVLKSNSGTFSYDIPAGTDPEQYPYVLIWCQRFSVLFGASQLMKP